MARTKQSSIVHPTGSKVSKKKAGGGKGPLLSQTSTKTAMLESKKNPTAVKSKPTPAKKAAAASKAKSAKTVVVPGSKRHTKATQSLVDVTTDLLSKAATKHALVKYSSPSNTKGAVEYARTYVFPAMWKNIVRRLAIVVADGHSDNGGTVTLLPRHVYRLARLRGHVLAGEPKIKRARSQAKSTPPDALNSAISQILEEKKKKKAAAAAAAEQQPTASKKSKSRVDPDEDASQEEAQADQDDTASAAPDQDQDQEDDEPAEEEDQEGAQMEE